MEARKEREEQVEKENTTRGISGRRLLVRKAMMIGVKGN